MRSSFFGLHVASSAMHAARGNLHTIGHNIANAETAGFSRQVAVQRASTPLRAGFGRGMIGTGSEIIAVQQVRNIFLDGKFRNQNSVRGMFTAKSDILALTQGILRDAPGQNIGLTSEVNDIFARMSDLAGNAGDSTYRRNFLSGLESLSILMNSQSSQLSRQMIDINQEIRTAVTTINSLGRQITSLNRQITLYELDGSNANDLRDQRNLLLDELSTFVNIEVREVERNPEVAAGRETDPRESRRELVVLLDGQQFINHFQMQELAVEQRRLADGTAILHNTEEPPRMYDVVWAGGQRFNMYSPSLRGELAGLINLRDGNGGNHTIVPIGSYAFTPATATTGNILTINQFGQHARTDIGLTGVITARGPAGQIVHIRYTGRVFTPPGVFPPQGAELELYENDVPDNFNPATWSLTIGETTDYMGIPYFKARLDELARTLARAFNEGTHLFNGDPIAGLVGGHFHGIDLNGNPGGILLTYQQPDGTLNLWNGDWSGSNGFNYFNITAQNFVINPALLQNPELMALGTDPTSTDSHNNIVDGWRHLTENRALFNHGRLGDFLSAITGDLGITARQANNFATSYGDLQNAIDNQRRAISGVSLDEEVTHMIAHQLVFQAAARLLSIIDGIYDTTINRMGSW